MLYLVAILFPPVAVLLCGKPVSAILNLLLCFLLWIPGVIHACLVVSNRNADVRADRQTKRLIKANRKIAKAEAAAKEARRRR